MCLPLLTFCSEGRVAVSNSCSRSTPVIILSDTGLRRLFLHFTAIPLNMILSPVYQESLDILCAPCTLIVPLFQVMSPGHDSLPATNVSVLIGHDLAGAQVAPNPIVPAVPTRGNNTRKLEQDDPKLFPARAVIRSINKTLAEAPLIENSNPTPVLVDQPRGVLLRNA